MLGPLAPNMFEIHNSPPETEPGLCSLLILLDIGDPRQLGLNKSLVSFNS